MYILQEIYWVIDMIFKVSPGLLTGGQSDNTKVFGYTKAYVLLLHKYESIYLDKMCQNMPLVQCLGALCSCLLSAYVLVFNFPKVLRPMNLVVVWRFWFLLHISSSKHGFGGVRLL